MLWDVWFNPNSFYSYCVAVPFVSATLVYRNTLQGRHEIADLSFPILFLGFMFPLPTSLTDPISHHLKFQCATLTSGILNLLFIPATSEGNVVVMTHGQVVVNDACSGIRAIISLLAMGCVFAYLIKGDWRKKLLVALFSLPIAILTNSFRITFLAIVTEFWGAKYVVGFVHDFAGFLIYGSAFVFLFFFSKFVESYL